MIKDLTVVRLDLCITEQTDNIQLIEDDVDNTCKPHRSNQRFAKGSWRHGTTHVEHSRCINEVIQRERRQTASRISYMCGNKKEHDKTVHSSLWADQQFISFVGLAYTHTHTVTLSRVLRTEYTTCVGLAGPPDRLQRSSKTVRGNIVT